MHVAVQDEDAVHKVLFLEKRVKSRVAATLVASGPAGYVHFWNVYDTSGPMGRYLAVNTTTVVSMHMYMLSTYMYMYMYSSCHT